MKRGKICVMNPDLSMEALPRKDANRLKTMLAGGPEYFLVLDIPEEGKVEVTTVFSTFKHNTWHITVKDTELWIRCIRFEVFREELFTETELKLSDPMHLISLVMKKNKEILKQKERSKKELERKRLEEKKLMDQLVRKPEKSNTKKYPYGSAFARREAPGKSVRVVSGGDCSPR